MILPVLCLHLVNGAAYEPKPVPLRLSNHTNYAYNVFEPYEYGFGTTELASSYKTAKSYGRWIKDFAKALGSHTELQNEVVVIVVGAGFGQAVYWLAKELIYCQTELRLELQSPDLVVKLILTTWKKEELQRISKHPHLLDMHLRGALDFAVFDILNESEPVRLMSGEALDLKARNMVFIVNYVFAALPYTWVFVNETGLMESWLQIIPNSDGIGWRDNRGCPDLERSFDFRWSLELANSSLWDKDAQDTLEAARSLCSGLAEHGMQLPTGPWKAVRRLHQIGKETLIIMWDETIPSCTCLEQPMVNMQKNIFGIPCNIDVVSELAKKHLGMYYLNVESPHRKEKQGRLLTVGEVQVLISTLPLQNFSAQSLIQLKAIEQSNGSFPHVFEAAALRFIKTRDAETANVVIHTCGKHNHGGGELTEMKLDMVRHPELYLEFHQEIASMSHRLNLALVEMVDNTEKLPDAVLTQLITCHVQLSLKYDYPESADKLSLWQGGYTALLLGLNGLGKSLLDSAVEKYGSTAEFAKARLVGHLAEVSANSDSSQVDKLEIIFRDFLQRRTFCWGEETSPQEKEIPEYVIFKLKKLRCEANPSRVCDALLAFQIELGKNSGRCAARDFFNKCNGSDISFWLQRCPKCSGPSPGHAKELKETIRQCNCFSSKFNTSSSSTMTASREEL